MKLFYQHNPLKKSRTKMTRVINYKNSRCGFMYLILNGNYSICVWWTICNKFFCRRVEVALLRVREDFDPCPENEPLPPMNQNNAHTKFKI